MCRPRCGGTIQPTWGSSSSPNDDGYRRTNNAGEKIVRQRPQPIQYVEPVKSKLNGCMFAGESLAPLPTALRYGKGLETGPIFTRTVSHSHASHRTHLTTTRLVWSSATNRVATRQFRAPDFTKSTDKSKKFAAEPLHQHSCKGAAILGSTHNALLTRYRHDVTTVVPVPHASSAGTNVKLDFFFHIIYLKQLAVDNFFSTL